MDYLFHDCVDLETIIMPNFTSKNLYTMNGIFLGCSSLQSIDLSKFNTEKVN